MGGEARHTALWHHLNGSHKGSSHNGSRWIGRLPFLARHSGRVRRSDLQRAAAQDPQNRSHWFGTAAPCKPFTGNLMRDLIANFTNGFFRGIPID